MSVGDGTNTLGTFIVVFNKAVSDNSQLCMAESYCSS